MASSTGESSTGESSTGDTALPKCVGLREVAAAKAGDNLMDCHLN